MRSQFGVLAVTIGSGSMDTTPLKNGLETSTLFSVPGGGSSSTELHLGDVSSGASCPCALNHFSSCSHLYSILCRVTLA